VTKKAGIYARISDDRGGEGLGVKRQETDCRALAKHHGWEVVEVYTDNDTSAYNGRSRPAYRQMLEAIKAGSIKAVVSWHPDRLHRSPVELEEFIDIIEASRAKVQTVTAGEYDLSTPTGRMQARIVGAVARQESEHKADRIRRKHRELAEQGKYHGGGSRPFGFNQDRRTIQPKEARLVREAAQRVLAGDSLRSIAKEWNARGIKSVQGGLWSVMALKNTLLSARSAGLREHPEVGPKKAEWPAILKPETRKRLQAILNDSHRTANKAGPGRKYLLTGGPGYCGRCGVPLKARPRNGKRAYACLAGPGNRGCGKLWCVAEPLEAYVRDLVLEALDGPSFHKLLRAASGEDEKQKELLTELEGLRHRREQLATDYADDTISREAFISASKEIDSRLKAINAQLRSSAETRTLASLPDTGLWKAWDQSGLDWRRALIGAVVERVEIGPATNGPRNVFRSDRVKVVWRV
jgi:site-specific DNA recombinase